jgi:hypothetical protein
MAEPPYWPFRCEQCSRFASNPKVTYNLDGIVDERGDCSRCGDGVKLIPLSWEDWFPEDFDPEEALLAAVSAQGSGDSDETTGGGQR